MYVRSDRQKGLNYKEIACKCSIDPRTVKEYAENETRPVPKCGEAIETGPV
ncbi:hypothetical protein OBV_29240 [Oscillibacter valericigenes Sjm18-20]|nr:hypothetical protein OBV_29240 [Oscillibacter valericigenes Sjm18-20]